VLWRYFHSRCRLFHVRSTFAFADTDELLGFGQLAAMARADQISPQDE
jgi:hypothetical protein